jgi:hypothetical protein
VRVERILITQAEALALGLRRRHIACRLARAAPSIDHLYLLAAARAAQHRPLAVQEGRLEHHQLIRLHRALDDVLTEAVAAADQHDITRAALRVEREHHSARGKVRAHHPLHGDGQGHVEVVEAIVLAVVDRTVREQAREAPPARFQQPILALHVQE